MSSYFTRKTILGYRYTKKEPIFRLYKANKETKWALIEALFVGFIEHQKEKFSGLLADQQTLQVFYKIKQGLPEKELKKRIFFAYYKTEMVMDYTKNSWMLCAYPQNKKPKLNYFLNLWKDDIKNSIQFQPIITDLAEREYVKNKFFQFLQFINTARGFPWVSWELFFNWNRTDLEPKNAKYPLLNNEDWNLPSDDD